MTLAGATPPP
ncbi:hypothetical protein CP02DC15_0016A, partial [Chlamydia psittaci 02DC15]